MDINHQDYFPQQQEDPRNTGGSNRRHSRFSLGFMLVVVCIAVALTIVLTYTLTSASKRSYYIQKLIAQQAVIDRLQAEGNEAAGDTDFEELNVLALLIDTYSYYAGKVSEEELLTAVLKAYARATGDDYAEYYTEEEYRSMMADNVGDHCGIGVSVIQTVLNVNGFSYQVFQIIAIYENAPAAGSELEVGDYIYCVKDGDRYKSIEELGGYSKAISMIQGEAGTVAEFGVLRLMGTDNYQALEFSIVRGEFETVSVNGFMSVQEPDVGIVRISNFDLTTPVQLKTAVKNLQAQGATRFVFDVRNNPGGDLQSIKAVMSYFLQPGDLIISTIDRNGKANSSYYAEPMSLSGDYAACNVSADEIGMFADLDMVVLCNGNTASAAEVFVATLRDYELAEVVGETTFGKGIMQSFLPLAFFGDYTGYIKMTTHAYVTECGVTYHDIGVSPTTGEEIELSEEAKQYNFYVLPQEKDNQLAAALEQLQ